MSASDYVDTYLNIWSWVNDTFTPAHVINYLQAGLGGQSSRAATAQARLVGQLPAIAGLSKGAQLPAKFEVQGSQYLRVSIQRVFLGKGSPGEIQDVIWLASQCGLVDESTLASYVNSNLGVDCGGFVANYWGIGRPSAADLNPSGALGFKPRAFWGMAPELRRRDASQIQVDDAAVFFSGVKDDDPDLEAKPDPAEKGAYIAGSGSKAFHIAVVSAVSAAGSQVQLELAESSGSRSTSGGDGVNVRDPVTKTIKKDKRGYAYCLDGDGPGRVYFVGSRSGVNPYMPNMFIS